VQQTAASFDDFVGAGEQRRRVVIAVASKRANRRATMAVSPMQTHKADITAAEAVKQVALSVPGLTAAQAFNSIDP
jgi:hypothetical protein